MVVSSTGKRKAVSASKVEPCLTAGQGKDPHKMEDDPKLDLQTQPESFLTEESEEEEDAYSETGYLNSVFLEQGPVSVITLVSG